MINDNYPMATAEKSVGTLNPRRQTIRERLEEQKRVVQEHLTNLDMALKFMDDNPNFENFHNILGKIGF